MVGIYIGLALVICLCAAGLGYCACASNKLLNQQEYRREYENWLQLQLRSLQNKRGEQ